jgi:dynein heavy chain
MSLESTPIAVEAELTSNNGVLETNENTVLASNTNVAQVNEEKLIVDYKNVVQLLQGTITLTGYTKKLWTQDHENTVIDFFSNPDFRKLVVFLKEDAAKNDILCLQNALPAAPTKEIMYYIKQSTSDAEPISESNFERRIQYGIVAGDAMESLLRTMQNLYLPLFSYNTQWPESIRKEFNSQLHRFMALLTDTTFQLKGHTVHIPI